MRFLQIQVAKCENGKRELRAIFISLSRISGTLDTSAAAASSPCPFENEGSLEPQFACGSVLGARPTLCTGGRRVGLG